VRVELMDRETGKIYDASVIKQLIEDGAIKDMARFRECEVPPYGKTDGQSSLSHRTE
jgi:hypothetical protein